MSTITEDPGVRRRTADRAPRTGHGTGRGTGGGRAWPWLLPLGAVLLLVLVWPVVEIVRLSFTDASLVSGEPYRVTADTYASLLRGTDFRGTLRVTFVFVLACVVFQLLLGLAIALLVHGAERRGLRGVVVTRTVVLAAWAIPGARIGQAAGSLIAIFGVTLQSTIAILTLMCDKSPVKQGVNGLPFKATAEERS